MPGNDPLRAFTGDSGDDDDDDGAKILLALAGIEARRTLG